MLIKLLREGLGRIIVFLDFITRPRPLKRSEQSQSDIKQALQGLSLYQFYACPFCVKTRRTAHKLNLPMNYRDAQRGPHRDELKNEGGRIKVSCLRIEEQGKVEWLYESKAIIDYLERRFAAA